MSEFLTSCDSKSLVKDKTCFKSPENPRCIYHFIILSISNFHKTTAVASGLSDFRKKIVTVCKTSFHKSKSEDIVCRDYKNFDINTFKKSFETKLSIH